VPSFEVDSVRLAELDRDVLHGRNFDGPMPGQHANGQPFRVVGWVLGKAKPAVAVEIVVADTIVGRVPVDVERSRGALGAGPGGQRAPADRGGVRLRPR